MVVIFFLYGVKILDVVVCLEIVGLVLFVVKRKKRDMRGGCYRFLISLVF